MKRYLFLALLIVIKLEIKSSESTTNKYREALT